VIHLIAMLSFSDELTKIAEKKPKLSGEVTLDRTHFVEELDNASKTPKRGPHPALNLEHSWSPGN